MKVFLSYGHDHNLEIVERIRKDLAAARYDQVWIDKEKIGPSDDWRRSILDGLHSSDRVLGFLSKHSVRDPGVCLDELAIALHHKGSAIVTILLEGDAEPPVSVSHIQWLDMHDWKARKAEGGAAWEAWYKEKFDQLLDILADPQTKRFAGEIEKLKKLLDPLDEELRTRTLIEGFVGRQWLLKRLDHWRLTVPESRLLWISGEAGTGKSAFVAWLGHFNRVNVISLNLCQYDEPERRDPLRVIHTLAFQIAFRLHDYRRILLDRFETLDPEAKELKSRTAASAFSWLLSEPLRLAIDGGRRTERFLVVIDGLDETVVKEHGDWHSELAGVLAKGAIALPPWLAIVVTGRPDGPIKRQFKELNPVEITAQSPENLADLREYLFAWLPKTSIPPADVAATVERIVKASDGNFLYAHMLRRAVTEGSMRLDVPGDLPGGLSALYADWFKHRFRDGAYAPCRRVISLIVAATTPIPIAWLKTICAWRIEDQVLMLDGLGSLFERRGGGIAPFHKSLRDWLIDPDAAGSFTVEEVVGSKALLDALWPAFLAWANEADHGPLDAFIVAELPAQIMRSSLDDLRTRLAACADVSLLWPVFYEVAGSLAKAYAWERALAWWGMIARLAEAADEKAVQAYALSETGDILVTLDRSGAALKSFRDGLAIAESLARSDPANADWQRDLSVSFNKVGGVLEAQGDRSGALKSFRDGLAIAESLARSDPANADWQRDLSVSFNKVGGVLEAQGDRSGALKSFRDGLAIAESLARSDPANADWQRDLSVSYERVGGVLEAQGDRSGALKSFRDGLAIRESLARSDPANADWQRDLSVSFNKVGGVLEAQGDRSGALKSFRDGLAIRESLARSDPANADWQRDLSVSYDRVGGVLEAQGDRSGALKSFRDGLAIRESLACSDPANADWQRDLSVSFNKVGGVLEAQGDRSGALKSFRDGLAIRESLARSDPANADWQRDLSVSYDRVGGVLEAQGDRSGALKSFRDGLAIAESLARSDPANADWQRDLSVSYDRVGGVLEAQGDRSGALKSFRDGLAIRESLACSDPANADWQRDLSVSFNKVGGVLEAQGDRSGALKSFRDGLAIAESLARSDPANADWQRDLSVSYERVGGVLEAQGDRSGALKSFRDGLAIRESLARSDPANADWQRDLSVSFNKVGGVLEAQGDRSGALKSFRDGLAIRESLARSDPANADWQRDLSVSFLKVGGVLEAQGDRSGALKSFRDGLAIAESLARSDPANADWQRDLSVSFNKVGGVLEAQGDRSGALKSFRDGLAIAESLARSDPANADWQRDLIVYCVNIAEIFPSEARALLTRALSIAVRLRDDGRLAPVDSWMPDDLERRLAARSTGTPTLNVPEFIAPARANVRVAPNKNPARASSIKDLRPLTIETLVSFAHQVRQWSIETPVPPPAAGRALSKTSASYEYSSVSWEHSESLKARGTRKIDSAWIPLAISIAIAAGLYFFRHELAAVGGWAAKTLFRSSVTPIIPTVAGDTVVDVSVYAQTRIQRGERFLVQVFIHDTEADQANIDAMATAADFGSTKRGVATLDVEMKLGDRLDFMLDGPGLTIEQRSQSLIWRGKPRACYFIATVPQGVFGTTAKLRIRVFRQAIPIGQISFSVGIEDEPVAQTIVPTGESSRRYRRAFLSYASSDRAEVLKRAQALRAGRIEFFNDLLSLEPGEEWEPRLYQEIEACDLFLLFWSQAARDSIWVNKEINHALACLGKRAAGQPEILPILIEGPPVAKPPDSLSHRHFNDPLLYLIAAMDKLEASHPTD